jgi:uncharacterized protein involved in exopolysaccharide biosynthesis
MGIPRKSSIKQNIKESRNSHMSEVPDFSEDSTMFTNHSRFSKVSRLFVRSKEFSETKLFKNYRESIDIDLVSYLKAVQRHWLPAACLFLASVLLSAAATTRLKPAYEAVGKLLFKTPAFNVVGNSLLPSSQEGAGDLKPLVSTQNPISTQMEIISSPFVLQKTIDKLQLKDAKGAPIEIGTLERGLKLQIVGGADVLKITYKSGTPEEAAAVVNTIIDTYLEHDILVNRGEAKAIRLLMAKQIPATKIAVEGAERDIRVFKQQNNVVNLAEETRSAVAAIGGLDTQISNVQAELEQSTAQASKLRQQVGLSPEDALSASAISQSPAIKATLADIQEIDRQLANKRSQFKDSNPAIVDLESKKANFNNMLKRQIAQAGGNLGGNPSQSQSGPPQINELKQSLTADLLKSEVQRLGLIQRLTSLRNSRVLYEQRIKVLPQLEQQQRDLERRLEVPQSTYQTLQKKVQELQVVEDDSKSTARVINKASTPKDPIPSMEYFIVFLGVLLGAFLATSLIVILEIRLNSKNLALEKTKKQKKAEIKLGEKNLGEKSLGQGKSAKNKVSQISSVRKY